MIHKALFMLGMLIGMLLSASCSLIPTSPSPAANMPNPASVYCEQNGGKLELRQDASGGVAGVCTFPDGSECDEWTYSRNECKPGDSLLTPVPTVSPVVTGPTPTAAAGVASDGWKIYRNEELGYSFHYPADTKISMNDEPLKSISIGPEKEGEQWPSISISHPGDREDYRPPEGAGLLQWLTDHNLLGEDRMPDVQIA